MDATEHLNNLLFVATWHHGLIVNGLLNGEGEATLQYAFACLSALRVTAEYIDAGNATVQYKTIYAMVDDAECIIANTKE